jgi:hypothetical protein
MWPSQKLVHLFDIYVSLFDSVHHHIGHLRIQSLARPAAIPRTRTKRVHAILTHTVIAAAFDAATTDGISLPDTEL